MKVTIRRTPVVRDERNRVTSHLTLEPHRRQSDGKLVFNDQGIFSKRIFGNLYRCDCGALREEGWCQKCGTRVVMPDALPDFYVDLGCHVPAMFADYDDAHRHPDTKKWNYSMQATFEEIQAVAEWRAFVYDDMVGRPVVQVVDDDFDPEPWEGNRTVRMGVDGLLALGVYQQWIDENMTDVLLVPHTCHRPMVISNGRPFTTSVNEMYSDIIRRINNVKGLEEGMADGREFFLMAGRAAIAKLYQKITSKLVAEVQDVEYSIIKSEIISHPISGAVRAVLINRHDIHEDVIMIGDTLVETLYPYLYKRFEGNMERINRELVEKRYVLAVNRPPTINHNSILGMYPRVASIYPVGHIDGTEGALLHNTKWLLERKELGYEERGMANRRHSKPWLHPERSQPLPVVSDEVTEEQVQQLLNMGDVEQYGQGMEIDPETGKPDGIDMWGLRCVGMNGMMMSCLNGDVDGDVLLEIALYSEAAMVEARSILPSKSYWNYANGTIRNAIIEDFIYAERCEQNANK